VAFGVASTIGLGFLASRLFGQSRAFGVLSGGAVGICGASAALAIASVLPRSEESERNTILVVVTVTALSTVAMITYPLIATAVGLDHAHAGIFLGGTIHDVAQVVGAGYTMSPQTGDVATYVKLLRVALLLPAVLVVSLAWRKSATASGAGRARLPLPLFLVGFAVLVAAGSFGLLPPIAVKGASEVSRWCLVAAVAALGMKTSFGALAKVGWRPVALIVLETSWIAAVVLIATLVWK
jgi:uncharacterized integral membrane protein (TIGR00698 family)